ncbi:hypothetical protein L6164_033019 [Bauhinia variegata]|uniref:Uncharacterized protein n=1 Tax=Bauhinia variegata TaxID=167791 RepID=A0ACB9KQE9_BAUVA|nr:hypothetical protein L6164_033019 [Bauhinia variegata]
MNAKDRLEFLMLSKRSVSDLSLVKPSSLSTGVDNRPRPGPNSGPMRVKMRVPKAQLEKLMEESNDQSEVAEKIMNLYMSNAGEADGGAVEPRAEAGGRGKVPKAQRKRVSFSPVEQEEIREEAGP